MAVDAGGAVTEEEKGWRWGGRRAMEIARWHCGGSAVLPPTMVVRRPCGGGHLAALTKFFFFDFLLESSIQSIQKVLQLIFFCLPEPCLQNQQVLYES